MSLSRSYRLIKLIPNTCFPTCFRYESSKNDENIIIKVDGSFRRKTGDGGIGIFLGHDHPLNLSLSVSNAVSSTEVEEKACHLGMSVAKNILNKSPKVSVIVLNDCKGVVKRLSPKLDEERINLRWVKRTLLKEADFHAKMASMKRNGFYLPNVNYGTDDKQDEVVEQMLNLHSKNFGDDTKNE